MSGRDMARRSLERRRGRTALSVLGALVGNADTGILFSIVAGYRAQAQQLAINLSCTDLTVVSGTGVNGDPKERFGFFTPLSMNESLVQSVSGISGVYDATSRLSALGPVGGNRTSLGVFNASTSANVIITQGIVISIQLG